MGPPRVSPDPLVLKLTAKFCRWQNFNTMYEVHCAKSNTNYVVVCEYTITEVTEK